MIVRPRWRDKAKKKKKMGGGSLRNELDVERSKRSYDNVPIKKNRLEQTEVRNGGR